VGILDLLIVAASSEVGGWEVEEARRGFLSLDLALMPDFTDAESDLSALGLRPCRPVPSLTNADVEFCGLSPVLAPPGIFDSSEFRRDRDESLLSDLPIEG
jgi:hypothetical protein